MSALTDYADEVVLTITSAFMRTEDPDERAHLLGLARAAVRVWRRTYARQARMSRMRTAYRSRRRHR